MTPTRTHAHTVEMDSAAREAQRAAVDLLDRLSHLPLNEAEAARLTALLDSRMRHPSPNPMREGFLTPDGFLRMPRWAQDVSHGGDEEELLHVGTGPRPTQMAHSEASGTGLVTNGHLGADIIRVEAGAGFVPHTHPGDHLLIVLAGLGTVTFEGRIYPTFPGSIYMIEGATPHAVGAIEDHVILAVGAPHKPVDSTERMTPVEYQAVTSDMDRLECMICSLSWREGESGCKHDPMIQVRRMRARGEPV